MSTTTTAYRITASVRINSTTVETKDSYEYLGNNKDRLFLTQEDAQERAGEMQSDLAETGLDPRTEYAVEPVEIVVGNVREVWESEDDKNHANDLDAYASVPVTIDGVEHRFSAGLGVQEYQHGTVRAGGSIEPSAWWIDLSDWESVGADARDAVLDAIVGNATRLWREVQIIRGAV